MTNYTNIGPKSGPIMWWAGYYAIVVLEARGGGQVGEALCIEQAPTGEVLWRLTVRGAAVPGLFVVVDREFRPAE
jgi:hypothetical protein